MKEYGGVWGEHTHSQTRQQEKVSGQPQAPGALLPEKVPPSNPWKGGLVGLRARTDNLEKRQILSRPELEPWLFVHPVRSLVSLPTVSSLLLGVQTYFHVISNAYQN
jgi:hypothetical protein